MTSEINIWVMIGNLLICLHLVILLNHIDVILLKIKMIKFGELYLHLLRDSTGNIEFNLEEMTSSTFISDNQIDISSFEIYPNPISNDNLTVVAEDILSNESQLEIFSITGEKVLINIIWIRISSQIIYIAKFKKRDLFSKVNSIKSSIQKKLVVH